MRVGILGLLHESNTFIEQPTSLEHFRADVLVQGEQVRERFEEAPHEIGGFFAGLREAGIEAVPLFAARATPYGTIAEDALEQLLHEQSIALRGALACDGILAAIHGAAVSERHPDADGHWLSRLRQLAGGEVPIIGTLDLHANLSQPMVDAADALIGYRTNPHVDQRQRGIEAARLMARTLRGEVRPTQAAALPPVAINIERQLTSDSPCRELYAVADEMLRSDQRILSNSVLLGFPYADVAEMGSSVIVITDNDPDLARAEADRLAQEIIANREQFAGEFLGVEQALDRATQLDGPVCLLDMGDNVGGGSPGDGTALARAIHELQLRQGEPHRPTFVCLADAQAVQQASELGEGRVHGFSLGGKADRWQGPPLCVEARVVQLNEQGRFAESAVTHGGITEFDQGPTAIVQTPHGLTLMLTTGRMPPFSLRQLTAFGLDPHDFFIIVAKGVHAPRAAYAPLCRHFLRVDTPGVTRADMTKLEYQHRRRPLFPFENW